MDQQGKDARSPSRPENTSEVPQCGSRYLHSTIPSDQASRCQGSQVAIGSCTSQYILLGHHIA